MKTIPLTQGYAALVDDEDYEKVTQFQWQAKVDRRKDGTVKCVYAKRGIWRPELKQNETQKLHRFIMGVTDSDVKVDHIDHNGLNCQRNNLRVATGTQNNYNSTKRRNTSSTFKGVYWHEKAGKWQACAQREYLGLFTDEIEAARAYDVVAKQLFGEFANLNFPSNQVL